MGYKRKAQDGRRKASRTERGRRAAWRTRPLLPQREHEELGLSQHAVQDGENDDSHEDG